MKRDKFKRLISISLAVVMLLVLTAGFAHMWYTCYSETIVLPYYRRGNWVLIGVYSVLVYIFFKAYGGFKLGYLKKTDMLYSQLLSIACVDFIAYFLISLIGRDFMRPLPVVFLALADFVFLTAWTLFTARLYFLIYPPRRLIILYGSRQAAALVQKMSLRVDKYMICESVSITEDSEKIKELIMKYEGVIICDIPTELRGDYVKFCYRNSVRTYIVPKISDIIIRGADDIRLFDTPLLLNRNYGLDFEQRLLKRCFDVVFSAILLLLLSPVMIAVAAAIKLTDGGPVLYKQERLTINGRKFNIYKFRSMVVDAEKIGGACLASENDPRITPVGRFIRSTRLDELPQLLNILKGEMSVVGPRPERPELCAQYEQNMPEFAFRLKVKAGLTGYAQVTGVYDTTPYDKLRMDLMYIENYSFRLDLQIVVMTLKTMLFPPNSNAADNIILPDNSERKEDNL